MDLNVKYSKNISKLNLVMSQKNYTPQASRTYSKYAKMTLYAKINQCSPYIKRLTKKDHSKSTRYPGRIMILSYPGRIMILSYPGRIMILSKLGVRTHTKTPQLKSHLTMKD